jgi:NADPH:quinone reductase-like Zn-dependent oxidoreductase
MFALLICLAAGIKPIITSSSDAKLAAAQALGDAGVVQTINYKTHHNWEEKARELTGGRGVDVVVDNIGPTAIVQNLSSLARRGVVSLVGFLGGFKLDKQPEILGQVLGMSAVIRFVSLSIITLKCGCQGTNGSVLGESTRAQRLTCRTFATSSTKKKFN